MRVGSLFSGIGAPECAWQPLGWEFRWCAEIDRFPAAVYAARFPGVPNLGDVTKVDWDEIRRRSPVDLLVAGSPCQSFSVAGKRLGMDDPRGNLAIVTLEIARRLGVRWLVFENVPGLLSSDGGRDFGAFLGLLGQCGHGFAYRVLDAQYFGVPQRRRRVFVVGHLGDWRRAAAVLFEPESLQGDPAPRHEARQEVAGSLGAGSKRSGGRVGRREAAAGHLVAGTLNANGKAAGSATQQDAETGMLVAGTVTTRAGNSSRQGGANANIVAYGGNNTGGPIDVATAVRAKGGTGHGDFESETFIAHSLRAGGHSKSHANAGVMPAVLLGDSHVDAIEGDTVALLRALLSAVDEETLSEWCLGILAAFWPEEVLRSEVHGKRFRRATQPERGLVNVALSRSQDGSCWSVLDLWQAGCDGCPPQGWQPPEQLARQLGAYLSRLPHSPSPAQRFLQHMREAGEGSRVLRQALSAVQEVRRSACNKSQPTPGGLAVRRLTADECEALQGFPRGWTAITYRGKPAADGPRYKAIGNSMAVPVLRWIGERIACVEAEKRDAP